MSNTLNYNTAAELFAFRHSRLRPQSMKYRRFASAAEAIRFAIEVLPADLLLGVSIEVGEERFDHQSIRRLYLSPDYPLPRRTRTPLQ